MVFSGSYPPFYFFLSGNCITDVLKSFIIDEIIAVISAGEGRGIMPIVPMRVEASGEVVGDAGV